MLGGQRLHRDFLFAVGPAAGGVVDDGIGADALIGAEMRGSVNRKVNCETANINKTVSAAIRQIEDIRYIEETTGFSSLPEPLEQMARLRLQYPEASLLELGKMLTPVVGKSGVNHRLRKLKEIAEDLRRKQGGEVL